MCGNHMDDCVNFPQRVCCTCYVCGEAIYEDEMYMRFDGVDICQNCVDDMMTIAVYRDTKGADLYE